MPEVNPAVKVTTAGVVNPPLFAVNPIFPPLAEFPVSANEMALITPDMILVELIVILPASPEFPVPLAAAEKLLISPLAVNIPPLVTLISPPVPAFPPPNEAERVSKAMRSGLISGIITPVISTAPAALIVIVPAFPEFPVPLNEAPAPVVMAPTSTPPFVAVMLTLFPSPETPSSTRE